MRKIGKARFATFIFSLIILLLAWGTYGLFSDNFGITSYWGIGISSCIALFFMFIMMGKTFGYSRAFFATLAILAVIVLALILNSTRGWPFGPAFYHDVLGWKLYKIAWPIPVFWSSIIGGALLLKKPKITTGDPKVLFSWAFDTAIITMLLSFIIEPIAKINLLITWVAQGSVLGVPISAFLGWFITSFIAAFVAMFILKPWTRANNAVYFLVPLSFSVFFCFIFIVASRANIALIQIFSAIAVLVFFAWSLRLKKDQSASMLVVESETIKITETR